jgi:hypothetical protein
MRDEELDRILDSGLERYSDVEPLDGLPQRILERVRTEARPGLRGWMAAGVLATAVLVGIVVSHFSQRTDLGGGFVALPVVVQRHEMPTAAAVRPLRRVKRHFERAKQQVFPTPTPMTSEEKSLTAVASEGQDVFPDFEEGPEPIVVVPVEVKPVTTELISNPN